MRPPDDAPHKNEPRQKEESYTDFVRRLSTLSVRKCYRAYDEIDWDNPEYVLRGDDPRLRPDPNNALAQTDWYRSLSPAEQSRFGLAWTAQTLKYGISFENVLSRGLLEFARTKPNGSPEHRYALHEVIEESHHSLMFQEFINRAGTDPHGITAFEAFMDRRLVALGGSFPEFFMLCVLAGEVFIDADNRASLARGADIHPLFRRVTQIHVTEEARHVGFAKRFLEQHLPALSAPRREFIAWGVPFVVMDSQRKLLQPSPALARQFAIPKAALVHAFGLGTAYRTAVERVGAPLRRLLEDNRMLGARHLRHWRRLGVATSQTRLRSSTDPAALTA